MKFFKIFLPLVFWIFFSAFRFIPQGSDETILTKAQAGQTFILNRKYAEAEKLFQELDKTYPSSPLGSFGLMMIVNTKMFENYDFTLDAKFEEIQKPNKILVDKIEKNKNSTAWDDFLCGASSGLRGFYFIRKDAYLKALSEAKQARRCLDRALQKDPRFADVYLGLGLYDYWTGVFSTRFKFFPIFKDRRKEGIAEIEKSIQEGIIANDLAMAALVFVLQEQRNSTRGLALTEELLKKYPNNVIIRTMKGNFLSYQKQHEKARAEFDAVLREDANINVTRYFKAMDYYRSKQFTEARLSFEEFLKNQPAPAWQAYAYYMLGQLDLRENRRSEAFESFKAGYKAYHGYKPNLKMILKLRSESN